MQSNFFLTLTIIKKISKSLDQLYISRISGLAGFPDGYPADQFGIRPDTGYQKGRISGASLVFAIENM
jgi:hypothetical protein